MGEQPGLSRRQMIKASAMAGAAAWTAPMIVGSLASPAAALSGGIDLSGPSYAMIVFDKGGSRYVLKITKSTCANTNDFSGDVGDFTIGSCGGSAFAVSGGKIVTTSGTSISTYAGSDCTFILNASGDVVTADPSITLILGVGHFGTGGCTNIPGGGTDGHLGIDCAPLNSGSTSQVNVGHCPV